MSPPETVHHFENKIRSFSTFKFFILFLVTKKGCRLTFLSVMQEAFPFRGLEQQRNPI